MLYRYLISLIGFPLRFFILLATIFSLEAVDIAPETKKFLQKNGPNVLRILNESREKDYAEIFEEAESRIAN